MANEIQVKLDFLKGKDEVSAKINVLNKDIGILGRSISSALGNFAGGAALAGVSAIANGIKNLASEAIAFGSSSVEVFKNQEKQVNRLNISLALSGEYSKEASQELQNFASIMQDTTNVGDDAVLSQIAFAKSLGATTAQAKEITKAAADASVALGISFDEAARSLTQTLSGSVGTLGRVIPGLRGMSEEALKSGAAIELVGKQFAGAASGSLFTFEGATIAAKNSLEDFQKEIGKYIVESPTVIGLTSALSSTLKDLTTNAGDGRATFESFAKDGVNILINSVSILSGALQGVNSALNFGKDAFNFLFKAIEFGSTIFDRLGVSLLNANIAVNEFLGKDTSKYEAFLKEREREIAISDATIDALNKESEERQKNVDLQNAAIQSVSDTIESNVQKQLEATRLATETNKQAFLEELNARNEASNAAVEIETNKLISLEEIRKAAKEREVEQSEIDKELLTLRRDEEFQSLVDGLGEQEAIKLLADAQDLKRAGKQAEARKKIAEGLQKAEENSIFAVREFDKLSSKERLANMQSTLGTISTLQKSSNKELFAVGKAAAISTATIDGIAAVQKALASAPPPFNFVLAALVGAATAANVAQIASQKPPAFQDGGIVPGNSFSGDQVGIRVNSGELILNKSQQDNVAQQLTSGGNLSQSQLEAIINRPIIIQIDGREIARVVKDQSDQGFRVA